MFHQAGENRCLTGGLKVSFRLLQKVSNALQIENLECGDNENSFIIIREQQLKYIAVSSQGFS